MKSWGILALCVSCLLVAPEALAAEEEHGGTGWFYLGVQVLNVAVLAFVLYRFAGRTVSNALQSRSAGIRARLEASESRLQEAESELAALRERLARVDDESGELVRSVVEQAEVERARALERARQSGERIREEARRVADNEILRARQILRDEAAALSTRLAAEMLREQITPQDEARLLADFVERARGPAA